MGGSVSTIPSVPKAVKSPSSFDGEQNVNLTAQMQRTLLAARKKQELVKIMLPVYYTDDEINDQDLKLATENWNAILHDTTSPYQEKRLDPNFTYNSAATYFFALFYNRLFDVHPVSRDLFKDIEGQGTFLLKMIALALSEKENPKRFQVTLIRLAEVHNQRGIKAVEYGIVGEALFWALRQSIGREEFTFDMHMAWVKLYCRMLKVMVPLAVAFELEDGANQQNRFWGHTIGMTKDQEEKILATRSMHSSATSNLLGGRDDEYQ